MPTTQHEFNIQTLLDSGPYPREAYEFVQSGLEHTQELTFEDEPLLPHDERHVRGQQLCLGLRDLAIARWGIMAPAVLKHWNVKRTDDFGRIVFAMVDAGLMSKTPDDSIEDFRGVFDFDEAFSREALVAGIGVD